MGSGPRVTRAIVLKRCQPPRILAVDAALMMPSGQPRSPGKDGAKQFLLNGWMEAGYVLTSLPAFVEYYVMGGFLSFL